MSIQIGNQVWVTHTRQVLFELERMDSIFKDAKSDESEYLYTGDPKYLELYHLAVPRLHHTSTISNS